MLSSISASPSPIAKFDTKQDRGLNSDKSKTKSGHTSTATSVTARRGEKVDTYDVASVKGRICFYQQQKKSMSVSVVILWLDKIREIKKEEKNMRNKSKDILLQLSIIEGEKRNSAMMMMKYPTDPTDAREVYDQWLVSSTPRGKTDKDTIRTKV